MWLRCIRSFLRYIRITESWANFYLCHVMPNLTTQCPESGHQPGISQITSSWELQTWGDAGAKKRDRYQGTRGGGRRTRDTPNQPSASNASFRSHYIVPISAEGPSHTPYTWERACQRLASTSLPSRGRFPAMNWSWHLSRLTFPCWLLTRQHSPGHNSC